MEKTLTVWGLSSSIDLSGCKPAYVRSPEKIREFIVKLCDLIQMERHGDVLIERFGEGEIEGYSAFQFIKTSSVTAHLDETQDRAFIDIFSCKIFDPDIAGTFAKEFFEAKEMKIRTTERT